MRIQVRRGVFLKVGEGDVSVPPVGDGVVEDTVEGCKVCRGGKGGAPMVVACCLPPNNRPHLDSGQSVEAHFQGDWQDRGRLVWTDSQPAATQTTNQIISANQFKVVLSSPPVLLLQGSLGAAKSM